MSQKNKLEKDIEKEMEKVMEKKAEEYVTKNLPVFGNILMVFANLAMIYVAHNVTKWDHSWLDFIKDDFNKILWAVDLALIASAVTALVKIFHKNKKNIALVQIGDNIFSLISLVASLVVYPYDLRELIDASWINTAGKTLLVIIICAVSIGTIAEAAKLMAGKTENCSPSEKK